MALRVTTGESSRVRPGCGGSRWKLKQPLSKTSSAPAPSQRRARGRGEASSVVESAAGDTVKREPKTVHLQTPRRKRKFRAIVTEGLHALGRWRGGEPPRFPLRRGEGAAAPAPDRDAWNFPPVPLLTAQHSAQQFAELSLEVFAGEGLLHETQRAHAGQPGHPGAFTVAADEEDADLRRDGAQRR